MRYRNGRTRRGAVTDRKVSGSLCAEIGARSWVNNATPAIGNAKNEPNPNSRLR